MRIVRQMCDNVACVELRERLGLDNTVTTVLTTAAGYMPQDTLVF